MGQRKEWRPQFYTSRLDRTQICPKCHKKLLKNQELVCIKKDGIMDRLTARHQNCEGFTIWRNPLNWKRYSGDKFTVDITKNSVEYFEIEFEILQTINKEWASEQIAKIAILDITPDIKESRRLHGAIVEWCALDCLRLRLENSESEIYRHILLDLIKQIAEEASIGSIRLLANEIINA